MMWGLSSTISTRYPSGGGGVGVLLPAGGPPTLISQRFLQDPTPRGKKAKAACRVCCFALRSARSHGPPPVLSRRAEGVRLQARGNPHPLPPGPEKRGDA